MGLSFSCPLASYSDLESTFQSLIVKSISFTNNDDSKTPTRAINFKGNMSNPTIFQSEGGGGITKLEGVVSLKITENESKVSIEAPSDKKNYFDMDSQSPRPKHEAAIKLQKVYKSFRTRRKLADCAVLIEQSWWKLLDFAELKRSSVSFFEIEKPETAVSRWSRARTRAAKVGKGLSKNSRAQKLALQHWLEAIDPRHRYGHNLHFYYVKWLHSQSKEPFFYWMDIGEGKEVNLIDKCSRWKLQQQCIKYLGPMERMTYEVIVKDGKFLYKQSGKVLDTRGEPKIAKWIFVLSTSMNLYVGKKKKGSFQHSSFLAGGATSAAGRIVVEKGMLKAVWPHSGHYRPTPENFQDFIFFLKGNSVDLANVKMDPDDEEEELSSKRSKVYLRSMSSEEDLFESNHLEREETNSRDNTEEEQKANLSSEVPSQTNPYHILREKLTNLFIPDRDDLIKEMRNDMCIPEVAILKRINSHKGTNSYQLGKQLSCKWTTGAGPRIGCLRDYPQKLQFNCLEKENLSPKSGDGSCLRSISSLDSVFPTRLMGNFDIQKATSFCGEMPKTRQGHSQNSPLCEER